MRVLFVGGGTLGSITPLLAVAEGLCGSTVYRLPTTDCCFWGTAHGPERILVEQAGIPFRTIPAGKFRRYFDVRNISDLFVMEWAFWVSLVRLIRNRPSVVVGAGSFVQVPVMWAAWFLRIPIVFHQLDVRPGLANRLCAPIARAITVTFPDRGERSKRMYSLLHGRTKVSTSVFGTRRRVECIGAPVRRAVLAARGRDAREAKRAFGFNGDRPMLLVLGGGTGAQALNDLVAGALPQLTTVADVVHVTGKRRTFECCESYSNASNSTRTFEALECDSSPGASAPLEQKHSNVPYRPFTLLTDHLPDALAAADLVVSRAGMGTIAELGALGKPTVLVPMPDTHQEENAAALEKLGAVDVWHQRDLTPPVFAERVRKLLADVDRCTAIGATFYRAFPADAVVRITTIIRTAVKD